MWTFSAFNPLFLYYQRFNYSRFYHYLLKLNFSRSKSHYIYWLYLGMHKSIFLSHRSQHRQWVGFTPVFLFSPVLENSFKREFTLWRYESFLNFYYFNYISMWSKGEFFSSSCLSLPYNYIYGDMSEYCHCDFLSYLLINWWVMAMGKYEYGKWMYRKENIRVNLISYPGVGKKTYFFYLCGISFGYTGDFMTLTARSNVLAEYSIQVSTPKLGGWEGVMRSVFVEEVQLRHISGLRRKARLPIHGQRTSSNGMTAWRLGLTADNI